jgi:hypothetical protein
MAFAAKHRLQDGFQDFAVLFAEYRRAEILTRYFGFWESPEIVNEELVVTQIFDHNAANFQPIAMCDIPKRRALQVCHFDILRVEIDPKMAALPSKVRFSDALSSGV